MLYKDDIKRVILYYFKVGFENGLDESEIIQKLPIIPGNENDKEQLYNDCKAYLFLEEVFIHHPSISINLAKKYIDNHNNRDINLVDEKLFTMYTKTSQLDLADTLLEKLLEKEPDNKWTIAKKINRLRIQGKHYEALEYINRKYDIIKKDPVIFDIQYKLVHKLTNGNPNEIINLFKRIPFLNFGNIPEKRIVSIKKLQEYLNKTYVLEKSGADEESIKQVRKLIKNKKRDEMNRKFFSPLEQLKKNRDLLTVENINCVLRKRNYNEQDIKALLESINNGTIKFCMQCQVSHSQGERSKYLAEKVKNYSRMNSSQLDEASKKTIRVLSNLLTGSLRNTYIHNEWIKFQNHYFDRIVNPSEQKNKSNENGEKSLGPTL